MGRRTKAKSLKIKQQRQNRTRELSFFSKPALVEENKIRNYSKKTKKLIIIIITREKIKLDKELEYIVDNIILLDTTLHFLKGALEKDPVSPLEVIKHIEKIYSIIFAISLKLEKDQSVKEV
jgi:hypothetical protein